MRYLWQHAFLILGTYHGELPLHHFLKQHYRQHPKLGSRDRRALSDMAYAWYRCSKAFDTDTHSREDLILAALFLCGLRPKALAAAFPEGWGAPGSIAERTAVLQQFGFSPDLSRAFPFIVDFSGGITAQQWLQSLLQQPKLFLRIRKERQRIEQLLQEKGISFDWLSDTCLALPNASPVDQLLPPEAYVIQDASSQETGRFFHPEKGQTWWDCCSGAGGKSLLLKDLQPGVQLTASDIRASILHNLEQRFRQYRLTPPQTLVLDTGNAAEVDGRMGQKQFDAIICDVPCSGSGTWARTPEQCYFFDPAQLSAYHSRQTAILRNAAGLLRESGRLFYITCSVFSAENETVIATADSTLEIVRHQLLNGISRGADCLFIAELVRKR